MTRRPLRGGFDRERLIDLRTKRGGYTRGDLARFAEVSVAAVRAWESGQATPQVDRLARVVTALEVPMSELVRIPPPHERYLGDLRVQAGLTQPQLALEVGISTASLSSLELGETSLREPVAERLGGKRWGGGHSRDSCRLRTLPNSTAGHAGLTRTTRCQSTYGTYGLPRLDSPAEIAARLTQTCGGSRKLAVLPPSRADKPQGIPHERGTRKRNYQITAGSR